MRIVLLGNAGAGKTTMAKWLIGNREVRHLSLDEIAWDEGTKRRDLTESLNELSRFLDQSDRWVIEGCYSSLVEAALPRCTELRFLNPGVDVCIAHCRQRPWEPSKFPSPEEQQAMLEDLIEWVRQYETRDGEYGLMRHRSVFDAFGGPKREIVSVAGYWVDPVAEF